VGKPYLSSSKICRQPSCMVGEAMMSLLLVLMIAVSGPTLQFSNTPETIRHQGTILSETLPAGEHTFFWHHLSRLNGDSSSNFRAWSASGETFQAQIFQTSSQEPKESGATAAKMFWQLPTKNWEKTLTDKLLFRPGQTITGMGKIVCKWPLQARLWIGSEQPMPNAKPEKRPAAQNLEPAEELIIWGDPMCYGQISRMIFRVSNKTDQKQTFAMKCQPRGGPSAFVGLIEGDLIVQRHIRTYEFRTLREFELNPKETREIHISTTGIGGCFYPMHLVIK